jgi:citrate lyase gamma subunit
MFGLTGCGYHFIGQESGVLSGIRSIAVPYFVNKSFEPGLERYVTEALVDEFVKSKFVKVVDESAADAVLRGRIDEFSESVISYDRDDRALEYRTRVVLDIPWNAKTRRKSSGGTKDFITSRNTRFLLTSPLPKPTKKSPCK